MDLLVHTTELSVLSLPPPHGASTVMNKEWRSSSSLPRRNGQPSSLQPPTHPCEPQQAREHPELRKPFSKLGIHPLTAWIQNRTEPRHPIQAPKNSRREDGTRCWSFGHRALRMVAKVCSLGNISMMLQSRS